MPLGLVVVRDDGTLKLLPVAPMCDLENAIVDLDQTIGLRVACWSPWTLEVTKYEKMVFPMCAKLNHNVDINVTMIMNIDTFIVRLRHSSLQRPVWEVPSK